MINEQLKTARELIQAKRFDEARELLMQIDHPTAKAWIEKMDAPGAETPISKAKNKAASSEAGSVQTILLSALVLMMALIMMLLIYDIFVKPDNTIDFTPVVNAINQNAAVSDWEYLTLSYTQFDVDDDDNREVIFYTDYGDVYDVSLFGERACNMGVNITDDDIACLEDNFIGLTEVMNILGEQSWEFISLEENSDQYSYSVDIMFKRPIEQ
jgi:hypothetical protein